MRQFPVDARDFGIVGVPLSAAPSADFDESAKFIRAFRELGIYGGAKLGLLGRRYGLSQTTLCQYSSVGIEGVGWSFGEFGGAFPGTPASGTIIKCLADPPSHVLFGFLALEGVDKPALKGNSLKNLSIDCNGLGGIGLVLSSVNFSEFKNVHICNATIAAIYSSTATLLRESRTTTRNVFQQISIWNTATDGIGMILDGADAGADTGGNLFNGIYITHKNGIGISLNNADSNIFDSVYCNAMGTGTGVVFNGSNTAGMYSRANVFRWLSAGSVIARGTSSFTHPSRDNVIVHYDYESNSNFPTIEAGAGLIWGANRAANQEGSQSTIRGDVSITLTPGVDTEIQVFNSPLTAPRTVAMATTNIDGGALGGGSAKFTVVRTANATGASALTVAGKALAVGQWCEVHYNGQTGATTVIKFGSL